MIGRKNIEAAANADAVARLQQQVEQLEDWIDRRNRSVGTVKHVAAAFAVLTVGALVFLATLVRDSHPIVAAAGTGLAAAIFVAGSLVGLVEARKRRQERMGRHTGRESV